MKREPVLSAAAVSGVITATIALLVAFGVHVSHEQAAAVVGFVGVITPLALAVMARAKVTPVAKHKES